MEKHRERVIFFVVGEQTDQRRKGPRGRVVCFPELRGEVCGRMR